MNRNRKDASIRKQEILQTALKLFVNKGYENTSTNDIIKSLNLSRGGLYHHFSSKEEILDTAITTLLLSEKTRVLTILDDDKLSAADKLKIVVGFDSASQPMADDVITLVSTMDNPTLLTHLLKKKLEIITPLFVDIIQQGIQEGIFVCKYPEEFSKISIILSTTLFTDTIMHMSLEEYKKMVLAFQSIVETMLGVTPGTFNFMNQSIIPEKW
ncbi:TetR/AcrR family transcriptional regulator [Oceanirhabdus seepicola]|uniref:TetR/AcrR family transcriptional regulator n=1 Tax=Oceanirhabdus seepicola TaxID=2828781 RepID=A0A9J6NXG4_9CLOT|nr:TetR/AcrR family transcriptional regulator [Oceanirhabdus seepicola]MCM1989146.1 TetR/AcrR family transcriptional regulator [Oceanirhabdus seepicola]